MASYGQAFGATGIWVDSVNNHLYVVDSVNRKIIVLDNAANDTKAPLWSSKVDQTTLNVNEAAVADAPTQGSRKQSN